jgi:hypothetical protein
MKIQDVLVEHPGLKIAGVLFQTFQPSVFRRGHSAVREYADKIFGPDTKIKVTDKQAMELEKLASHAEGNARYLESPDMIANLKQIKGTEDLVNQLQKKPTNFKYDNIELPAGDLPKGKGLNNFKKIMNDQIKTVHRIESVLKSGQNVGRVKDPYKKSNNSLGIDSIE